MRRLPRKFRPEACAAKPEVEAIDIVSARLALASTKHVRRALNRSNSVMTETNEPPAMYQNRLPSSPHVLPWESSALFVSVNLSSWDFIGMFLRQRLNCCYRRP